MGKIYSMHGNRIDGQGDVEIKKEHLRIFNEQWKDGQNARAVEIANAIIATLDKQGFKLISQSTLDKVLLYLEDNKLIDKAKR